MSSRRTSIVSLPGGERRGTDLSGNQIPSTKKYLNGWTPEQEKLMAKWADIAGCYRWLHDRAEKGFSRGNAFITIPVIILSTLTGTANFALSSFIPPDDVALKNYAQAGIGAISIFAGILTTLGNFLRYAQGSEAHRVAGVAWGKLHRQITVEVAIHPDDREDSMTFLQICRQDLDRLVEQSPPIPDNVIAEFDKEFKDISGIQRPDICHGLEHTTVFNSTKPRLMRIAAEATLYLRQRKKLLRDDIVPDMKDRIDKTVGTELDARFKERWKDFEEKMKNMNPPKKAEVIENPPNPSFVANWRRFIRRKEEPIQEEIYRDSTHDDEDIPVSIQSDTPSRSRAHSLTGNEINEGISSGSSKSDMVISIKVNANRTPVAPSAIIIPNTTPAVDISGSDTVIDISGAQPNE